MNQINHISMRYQMAFTRKDIDRILLTNDLAVERAIVVLYKFQTAHEKARGKTTEWNNVGFTMTDATPGTRFARWILGMDNADVVRYPPKSLNHPQAKNIFGKYCKKHGSPMGRARAIALKHSAQLVLVANKELEVPE